MYYFSAKVSKQRALEQAHAKAYQQTVEYIEEEILLNYKMLPLVHICDYYRSKLEETEHPNQKYRVENLKVQLKSYWYSKPLLRGKQ